MDVWYCWTDALSDRTVRAYDAWLSCDERARRERLAALSDRLEFTAAHGLARLALSHQGSMTPPDWRFERAASGKPAVIAAQAGQPPLTFSLTHTKGLVACAVARGGAVGVDAERADRSVSARDIARRCFAPHEVDMLDHGEPDEYVARFVELWTLKESFVKAIGLGLSRPFDSFTFSWSGVSSPRTIVSSEAGWSFVVLAPSPSARVAIAARPHGCDDHTSVTIHGLPYTSYEPTIVVGRSERAHVTA